MILNKKFIFFLAACLLFSGLGYKNGYISKAFTNKAFAEDNKEKDTEGDVPCPECPECPDAAKIVLRGLEEKRIQVEKSQQELAQEKKELERYEEQIDEKLVSLETLKKQISDDMALLETKKTRKELEKEAAYEAKIARLVKMYAGMKPKKAAQIVDQMTLDVAQ
jgi:flagellar motility protein MotE (MotC chaperone)